MADRELLELAARAARISPVLCYESKRNCLRIGNREHYRLWRPLTDPGDALRLAVAMHIELKFQAPDYRRYWTDLASERGDGAIASETGPDPLSATMRAITRAAAEVGRTKT